MPSIRTMNSVPWEEAVHSALLDLKRVNLRRHRRMAIPWDATHIEWEGRRYINFASNNYLGLSQHSQVIAAAAEALRRHGAGAAASPLICGYGPAHDSAERQIARWKGTEACVLLPSGHQANQAAVQTLAAIGRASGRGVRFLLDKLCHASLIDAVRGSGASFRVFPHNHVMKLRRLLEDAPNGELQAVVTESIFSMDGDAANLPAIADLKRQHAFVLLLDEAHATGVYGANGTGLASELGFSDAVDVTIVTLSKAIGSAGGVVCASAAFCDALVNLARAYLYSTGIAPAAAAAAEAAISIMQNEPRRQQRVRELARQIREKLRYNGFAIPNGDSPIIPIILGSEASAMWAADELMAKGLFVPAIRPPTVPRGGSRLRITLCCEHTDAEVESLLAALRELNAAAASYDR